MTIDALPCDAMIAGTPGDLACLIRQVSYGLGERTAG